MFSLLIWLLVLVLVLGIIWWILGQIPIPPVMRPVVSVVFGVIALLMVLYFAMSLLGSPHLGGPGLHRLD